MSEKQASYRQIMKATSIFGGVQVINILVAIIRSKFIAVLLGPSGIGIAGLLNSTAGLITGLTSFGLGTSGVKNISAATGDKNQLAIIVTVLRRWVWVTGLLGMIVTIFTAPLLSSFTFGNADYTFPFIWISVSLLFTQLSSGEMVLLQGMRKLQFLAKANLSGSILGLIFTVPLYYLLGMDGIVPGIIISSLITFAASFYYARKNKIEKIKVSQAVTLAEGKEMLIMGFMISLSGIISLGTSYIVRIFISNYGGVAQVGLYNAGFAIINSYVGLIFMAMSTDYYPRLAAVSNSNKESSNVINQQAEIAILLMTPIIILFLVFINWIVIILYSMLFSGVNVMVLWAALGMLFKAASWAIGFIFLAKGASRLFFWNELLSSIYMLTLNIIGYYYYGLSGLGISFFVGYLLYLLQVFYTAKIKFEFRFHREIYIIFLVQFSLALIVFLVALLKGGKVSYITGCLLFLISALFSYKELNKRIDISNLIKVYTKNFVGVKNG